MDQDATNHDPDSSDLLEKVLAATKPRERNRNQSVRKDIDRHDTRNHEFYLEVKRSRPEGATLVYQPRLLGIAEVYFREDRLGLEHSVIYAHITPFGDGPITINWPSIETVAVDECDVRHSPARIDCEFSSLPRHLRDRRPTGMTKNAYRDFIYRCIAVTFYTSLELADISGIDESEREFRIRLLQLLREKRDREAELLRTRFAPKLAAIDERIRKAAQMVEGKQASEKSKLLAFLNFSASILSAFLGKKTITATTIGKATTSISKAGKSMKDSQDASMAEENVETLKAQKEALEKQFNDDVAALNSVIDPQKTPLDEVQIRPKKTNIEVRVLALAWAPWWKSTDGKLTSAWK